MHLGADIGGHGEFLYLGLAARRDGGGVGDFIDHASTAQKVQPGATERS
jgi:hypothetical protein